tara:strand:- start:22919 stop:26527 length:3609 start_codon:yes stop_codon:yes gene_type:complete
MPPIVIAVVAAAAAYAVASAPVIIAVLGVYGAMAAGSIVGALVSYGLSMAWTAIEGKPRAPSLEQSSSEQKHVVRSSIAPRRIIYGEQRVGGVLVYAGSSGANQGTLHLVVALAGHPVEEISTIWFGDDAINPSDFSDGMAGGTIIAGKYAQRASIGKRLGNQLDADQSLISQSPDGWTADHKLLGVAYLHVSLVYDPKLFQGIPSITALVKGKNDILDPRSNTRGYSTNWANIVLDYLLGDQGLACDADELDLASFIAAANLSDEAVPLSAGGATSQPRYTLNGSFTLDAAPITVVEGMLAAAAGALVYVAGAYRLHGGAYVNPTASLTESDFAGPVELQTMPPRSALFNGVRGTFIDPNRFWQASQFPVLQDTAALAADGEEVWRDVEFAWIIDADRAQRIARQILHRTRAPLTVRAPLRYAAIQFSVWQTVTVTLADLGWNAKPFRVTSFSFDPSSGGCTVELTEEQVAAYAWLYDQAIAVPDSPNTTLIDPLTIPAPTNLVAASSTAIQPDGSIAPAIDVSWTASNHAFVTAHEVQWRVPAGEWLSRDVAMPTVRLVLEPVVSGVLYEVQVRGITGLARGPWIATSQTATADTTAPGIPTGISMTGVLRGISISWTLPPESDFASVEVHENTSANTSGRYYVGESSGSGFLRIGLPPSTTRWYWVRSRDRTGNLSAFSGTYSGTSSVLLTDDIGNAIIDTAKFASGIAPVVLIANLSATAPDNTTALNTADGKLYTRIAGQWVATVQPLGPGGTLTSDQIESLAAAKLAGQITETQIEDDAISTPKLQAGAVVAATIAAGAVTTAKLSVGSGTNDIWNSCCTRTADGWVQGAVGGLTGTLGVALRDGLGAYALHAFGAGYLSTPGVAAIGQSLYADWSPGAGVIGIPCKGGDRIQARALLGAHRCTARIAIFWINASGVGIGTTVYSPVTSSPAGGAFETDWSPHAIIGTAPSGAGQALLRVEMIGTGGGNPYCFFTQTMLSKAPTNATEVAAWSAGGVTDISGGQLRTNSVTAEQVNTDELFADAGTFNSLRAGIASFGGLTATEIAAGAIRADKLASEEIISQTVQVANLIIGTDKITAEAVSTLAIDHVSHGGGAGSNVYVTAASFSVNLPQARSGSLLVTWTQGYTATPRASGIKVLVDGVVTRNFETNATVNYNTLSNGLTFAAGTHSIEVQWRGEPGTLLYDVDSIVLVRAK